MTQGVAKLGLSGAAAADEIEFGCGRTCWHNLFCSMLQQLMLSTCFAGAVCAGDRVRHDHQHCAQGARHAERVRA